MSDKKSLNELKSWIDEKVKEYKQYLKMKSFDNQLLLTINYDEQNKDIDIEKQNGNLLFLLIIVIFKIKIRYLKKLTFFE